MLLGLDLWASAGDAVVVPVSAWRAAGVASMAGGVYVFMVGVADRVFRGVGRRMSMWAVESAVLLVFLGGVAIAAGSLACPPPISMGSSALRAALRRCSARWEMPRAAISPSSASAPIRHSISDRSHRATRVIIPVTAQV
ncbi:hypothetical protein J4558_17330 [Leptolyngbya sp. 15MV]|nr:hypothetical protein J4558_17330 [Leptolyngbya sp. 15MV]